MRLQSSIPESKNLLHILDMQCQWLQKRLIAKEGNVQYEKGQQSINLRRSRGNPYDHPNLISSKAAPKSSTTNSFTEPTILVEFERIF